MRDAEDIHATKIKLETDVQSEFLKLFYKVKMLLKNSSPDFNLTFLTIEFHICDHTNLQFTK